MKRILREPLLHFLLLGAGLFIAFSLVPKSGGGDELRKIVITQGQLDSLVEGFARTRQRPPTREEWEGLIRDQVRQEVYYREALALRLDKDDIIIRRRLAQKMQFISDDSAVQAQPTEDELNGYLQAHPDNFRVEPQYTFRQVYLNPTRHGAKLKRDAAQLLAKLNGYGGDAGFAALGDPLMLDHRFTALTASEVARQFGDAFATQLSELQPGRWQGPLESGFGVHLVYVSDRTQGHLPALNEVRDAVRREWEDAQRQQANDKFYRDLLKHYTVAVEREPTAIEKKIAASK
jgi:hypothetical protein